MQFQAQDQARWFKVIGPSCLFSIRVFASASRATALFLSLSLVLVFVSLALPMAPEDGTGTGDEVDVLVRNGVYDLHSVGSSRPLEDDSHPTPLKIAIAGAGIGGLTAAIGLRRNGHEVHVYEQSRFASELGAAIHLAPNSNGILRRWGIFAEQFGANTMDRLVERAGDGRVIRDIDLTLANKRWQHPWHLVHRVNLHNELKKLAVSEEAGSLGIPVKLYTASKVVEINPDEGTLTLEDGTTHTADMVIGADGIYSTTRRYIKDTKLFSSGKAAFRFLIPRQVAEADPITAPLVKHRNALAMWYANDRRIVMYPCNNNQLLNFVCIHPDTEFYGAKDDGWNKQGSLEQVLSVYKEFDPAVKALISKVDPQTLKVWQLLDMEKMPTWSSGKLILLGDAAHPFTPHQGQGCGQAIEDAAALTIVLPIGTTVGDIPERFKLYEQIRYERAHTIQHYSRLAGRDWTDGKPTVDMMAYTNYNFGHDEIDHARNIFKRWQWSSKPNLLKQTPLGFELLPKSQGWQQWGKLPERRQMKRQNSTKVVFKTTATIRFKTSRTFLETLFPTTQLRFQAADTVATASFSITIFANDCSQIALYIHGVQFVKTCGRILNGTYVPVLLQSPTRNDDDYDDITCLPKLSCEITTTSLSSSEGEDYRIAASWRGAQFAEFVLAIDKGGVVRIGRQENSSVVDNNIFICQYTDKPPGKTGDIDNGACVAMMVMMAEQDKAVAHLEENGVSTTRTARTATIKIDALDWETLPTLHHVTSALGQIPVYEVIHAEIVDEYREMNAHVSYKWLE
ncbi:hypothetical protein B0H63DRAFT_37334 [Podospora didyma]|uniref:FAD-binding domain-containing protein n=1 Tax=Podospora didyma TaxID=330526 RepID=A0AAE0U7S1_9PEZI|nr:hypothetical protein B0H63DRAFT_37334 [Podospora didyma]